MSSSSRMEFNDFKVSDFFEMPDLHPMTDAEVICLELQREVLAMKNEQRDAKAGEAAKVERLKLELKQELEAQLKEELDEQFKVELMSQVKVRIKSMVKTHVKSQARKMCAWAIKGCVGLVIAVAVGVAATGWGMGKLV